jgi:hypothetical protein
MTHRLKRNGLGSLQALALWLGLAGLILQGFAPLGLGAMATDGKQIVICTMHGMQTIRIGADGKPLAARVDSDKSGAACSVCSDCTAGGGFVLPSPIIASHPVHFFETVRTGKDVAAWASRLYRPYISRAPPVHRLTAA